MANDEIVVGRVESGAVGTATLEVGAQSFPRAQGNQVVVRSGAHVFPLRVSPAVLVGERVDGRWGEVAGHRLAAMFADIAPGDHVEVRISGAALADENAASSALLQAEAMASTQAADAERSAATAAAAAALAALAMAVWALVEADGWDGAVPRGSGGAGIGSATLDSAATANVGRHRGRRRRNGRPVLTATITRVVHSVGSGRGGWTWEELTVTMTDTIAFQLDTGAWHADVYTKGMTWAAPPVRQPVDEKRAIRAVAAVCPGDRVRVLARTGEAGDNDIRAGGPESLFLIAGTPSDFLRRALRPPLAILAYVGLAIASTLL